MGQKTVFVCQQCGANFAKWSGQCNSCANWNTLTESLAIVSSNHQKLTQSSSLSKLSDVDVGEYTSKISTHLTELDRVLGGGIISGMTILIGGAPGIGKSTLLSQVLGNLSQDFVTLYISGEESLQQVSLRAARINVPSDNVYILATTSVEEILEILKKIKPRVAVVDSIQTIFSSELSSSAGSVSQVRECASLLIQFAKINQMALFIVGHVTKDGTLAGPRVLEHMVDTVLYFEGDQNNRYRMLRCVKNRFGPANELGVFAMSHTGLQPVSNPSAIFLSQFVEGKSGSLISSIWEGTRPILVELQALIDQSHLSNPRRVCVGMDHNRVSMILAILHRHADICTGDQDVYINVVGGIKVNETAADLAIALAIYSSLHQVSISKKAIIIGELGLSGEIRPVQYGLERLIEAAKIGFELAIIPSKNMPKKSIDKLEVITVDSINDAINVFHTNKV